MKNVTLTLAMALIAIYPRPDANLRGLDALTPAESRQSINKIPVEERLLANIPKEYKEPGSYEQLGLGPLDLWTRVATVRFERQGGGWEVLLSPDYSKVAYRAKMGGKVFIVINDKKGPDFDDVRYATFSPDGSKLAYAAKLNKRWFIVAGDEKGPEFDTVGPPIFSPDGSRLAYGAESEKKEFLVVDGQKGQEFDHISSPVFSSDGKTLAFVARPMRSKTAALFVGDKKVAEHTIIGDVTFAPGGDKIAYAAGELSGMFMVVGDKKGPGFESVFAPTFSPDGNKVAYLAMKSGFRNRLFVVSGDYQGTAYTVVTPPVFTPDGSKVVYVVGKAAMYSEGKILLHLGDKVEESKCMTWGDPALIILLTGVESRRKTFTVSPDGSKVACKAPQSDSYKLQIGVGNQLGPEFDDVGTPVFSPDGTRVGYWARKGREIWWKVITVQ